MGGNSAGEAVAPRTIAEWVQREVRHHRKDMSGRTHAALLTSIGFDRPLTVDALRGLFQRWSATLGYRVTPHMLRHTYALLLRQSGVPDRVSMDLLGHRSLSMLQRYSHVFDGEHREEAAKVLLDL